MTKLPSISITSRAGERWLLTAAAGLVVAVLAAGAPLFICMPPWVDSVLFDICARLVVRGETLYREVFLHGPPGMVLSVAALRSIVGSSSEALRACDLIIVLGVIGLWVGFGLPPECMAGTRAWTALGMLIYYLGTTEWCHCQPDTWMMLPAMGAFALRMRRTTAIANGLSASRPAMSGFAEGLLWGYGCLLKPFAALPAAACWGASTWSAGAQRRWRLLALDTVSVLLGGACALAITAAWLIESNNWRPFLETVFSDWNREYYATSGGWLGRLSGVTVAAGRWGAIEWLAAAVAAWCCLRQQKSPRQGEFLAAAFTLAGFIEGNFIQRQSPYQVVPAVLFSIGFLCRYAWPRLLLLGTIFGCAVFAHPLLNCDRLRLWPRCWQDGSSAAMRNALTIDPDNFNAPDWVALGVIERDLRARAVKDRELTCYGLSAVPLYWTLDVKPSTRYVELWATMVQFPGHAWQIQAELHASPQCYVVNDLCQGNLLSASQSRVTVPGEPLALPPDLAWELSRRGATLDNTFPFMLPVIAREGRYVVHEVRTVVGRGGAESGRVGSRLPGRRSSQPEATAR